MIAEAPTLSSFSPTKPPSGEEASLPVLLLGHPARLALDSGPGWTVLAVFRRSLYCRAANGALVCVGPPSLGPGPLNILALLPPDLDWQQCPVFPGAAVDVPRRAVAADTGPSDRVRRCPRLAAGGTSRPMGHCDTRRRSAGTRVGSGPPASTKRPGLVGPESRHPPDALPTRFRPREGLGPDGGAGRRCAPKLADDRNVAWCRPVVSVTRRGAPRRPRTGPHALRRRSARRHPDRAARTRLAGGRGCPRDVVASARPLANPRHQLRAPLVRGRGTGRRRHS